MCELADVKLQLIPSPWGCLGERMRAQVQKRRPARSSPGCPLQRRICPPAPVGHGSAPLRLQLWFHSVPEVSPALMRDDRCRCWPALRSWLWETGRVWGRGCTTGPALSGRQDRRFAHQAVWHVAGQAVAVPFHAGGRLWNVFIQPRLLGLGCSFGAVSPGESFPGGHRRRGGRQHCAAWPQPVDVPLLSSEWRD